MHLLLSKFNLVPVMHEMSKLVAQAFVGGENLRRVSKMTSAGFNSQPASDLFNFNS